MFGLNFSQLTQFHENPTVIAWWQRQFQPFLDWFSPDKRRAILAIGAIWAAHKLLAEGLEETAQVGFVVNNLHLFFAALLLAFVFALGFLVAFRFAKLPVVIKKHPLASLHLAYWAFLFLVWNTRAEWQNLRTVLFIFATTMPYLVWRLSYLLVSGQLGRASKSKISDHLLTLLPIYGGSETPYGKGIDFLSQFEAKDATSLAKSQLAGIKLLLLELVWRYLSKLIYALAYGPTTTLTAKLGGYSLQIPELTDLAGMGDSAPLLDSWLSIYLELFMQVLHHAAYGLGVVGVLRLFGFNIFRNTYKPLLAESVVEFWNRYYYYFKELLANFFFMPTFMQLGKILKNKPKLRLLLAVFAAAFVGNMYYHIIEHGNDIAQGNVFGVIYSLRSRFFYCLLLATGIYISMLREQRRMGEPQINQGAMRYFKIFSVWTFFAMIYIWNVHGDITFADRTQFFLHLFGI